MTTRLETLASAIEQILARLPDKNAANDDVVENVRVEAEKEIKKRAANFSYVNVNQKPRPLWTKRDITAFEAAPVEIDPGLADKLANTNSLELADLLSVYKTLCKSTTLKRGDETQTITVGSTHDQVFPRFQPTFVDDAFKNIVSKLWNLKWKAEYEKEKENLRKRYFLAKFSEPFLKPFVKAMAFDRDVFFPVVNGKRSFNKSNFEAKRPEENIVKSFLRNIAPPQKLEAAPLPLNDYTRPLITYAQEDYVVQEATGEEAPREAKEFFVDMFLFFDPTTFLVSFDFTITATGMLMVAEQTRDQVKRTDKQFEVASRETIKDKFVDTFVNIPAEFIKLPVPFTTLLNNYTTLKKNLVDRAYIEYSRLFVPRGDVNGTLDMIVRLLKKNVDRQFDQATYNFILQKLPFFEVSTEDYNRYVEEKLAYPQTDPEREKVNKTVAALEKLRQYFTAVKHDLSVFKNFVTYLFFEKNNLFNARPDLNQLQTLFETLSGITVVLNPTMKGEGPAAQSQYMKKVKDEQTFLKNVRKMYNIEKDEFIRKVASPKNDFIKVALYTDVETLIKEKFPFFNEEKPEHKTFVKNVAEDIFTFYDENKVNTPFFVVPVCDRNPWTATYSAAVCDAYQQLFDALKPNPVADVLRSCNVTQTHEGNKCTARNDTKVYDLIENKDGACNASAPVLDNKFCVKCKAETPVWDGSRCTQCPAETPEWRNEKCNACTQNAPYFYNNRCNAQPENPLLRRRVVIAGSPESPSSSTEWD